MFTRYSPAEIQRTAPCASTTMRLREGSNDHKALYVAVCSLERIAGIDSPEGDNPETDALRALRRIRVLLEGE